MLRTLGLIAAALIALSLPASAQTPPARAPLDLFVGYDSFRSADISPNGRYVAAIHHEAIGDVLTVIDIQEHHIARTQVARADQQMRIDDVQFKSDSRLIFEISQRVRVTATRSTMYHIRNADDAFEWDSRIFSSNLDGSGLQVLYDPSAAQGADRQYGAGLVSTLDNDPDNVLLIVPGYGGPELWRVNINTGAHTSLEHGNYATGGWAVDRDGAVVLRATGFAGGRGYAFSRRGPGQSAWTEFVRFVGVDAANSGPTFEPIGPGPGPGQLYVLARRAGEDGSGLFVFDTATGQYSDPLVTTSGHDISDAIFDHHTNTILAACWAAYRDQCEGQDPAFARTWNSITRALGDNVNVSFVAAGGADHSRWLVYTNGPQDLGTYYLYDGAAHTMNVLFGARPEVDDTLLPTERVVQYTTSDGQHQWGYLWIPPGVTNPHNLPTIVMPHGGPESRDTWGHPIPAAFASQGYAVFQPNFRGGGGFGRAFVAAGWRQWGQRMQDDVSDGVRAIVAQGFADANRMCIWGWSYGGYVAETASFQNTDLYKCSVAGAGISDQAAMLRWARDGQRQENDVAPGGGAGGASSTYAYWSQAMGNLGADDAMLNAHSAAQNADRVGMPLLLIHGDEDWTVPIEQSQIMQRAMEHAGHPVRLITLHDANHFYTPDQGEAWRTVLSESLTFIGQNIGPGVAPGSQ